jgi:hypothetical protein
MGISQVSEPDFYVSQKYKSVLTIKSIVMKMNKFAIAGVAFILGAISVISFIALVSFTHMSSPTPASGLVTTVSATEANTLLKNYLKTAPAAVKQAKGIFLDLQELEALNSLASKDAKLAGFRLYLGKETNGKMVGLVVGVDANNLDLVSKNILKTQSPKTGLCPPVCDQSSTITKE